MIRPDGRNTRLNTFDGTLGSNTDPDTFTYDALDEKSMAKKLGLTKPNGYREVAISECPFAVSSTSPEAVEPQSAVPDGCSDATPPASITAIASAESSIPPAQATDALRRTFGVHGKPIVVTKSYVKTMDFSNEGYTDWIAVTVEGRWMQILRHGDNYKLHEVSDEDAKEIRRNLGGPDGYREVAISECRYVVAASETKTPGPHEVTNAAVHNLDWPWKKKLSMLESLDPSFKIVRNGMYYEISTRMTLGYNSNQPHNVIIEGATSKEKLVNRFWEIMTGPGIAGRIIIGTSQYRFSPMDGAFMELSEQQIQFSDHMGTIYGHHEVGESQLLKEVNPKMRNATAGEVDAIIERNKSRDQGTGTGTPGRLKWIDIPVAIGKAVVGFVIVMLAAFGLALWRTRDRE